MRRAKWHANGNLRPHTSWLRVCVFVSAINGANAGTVGGGGGGANGNVVGGGGNDTDDNGVEVQDEVEINNCDCVRCYAYGACDAFGNNNDGGGDDGDGCSAGGARRPPSS